MPVVENKSVTELTWQAFLVLILFLIGAGGIICIFCGYTSLGVLAIAIMGIIIGFWWLSAQATAGGIFLSFFVLVLIFDAWLGTPILDWHRLIESLAQ